MSKQQKGYNCRVMFLCTSGQEDTQVADRSGEEMCPRWKVHPTDTTSCLQFLSLSTFTASAPSMTNPSLQTAGSVTD